MVAVKIKKRPPYEFVLDELADEVTAVKPMFGGYGVYRGDQILMIFRKKEKFDNDTGIWVGVTEDCVPSLKKVLPELRDLEMFGSSPTAWQVLGEDIENFEEVAFKICSLIQKKDPRIGRTPKKKLHKAKAKVKAPVKKVKV
jgi:hypothetical protein